MINTIVQYLLLFYKQNDDVIIKIMVSCSSEGMQQTQSHYLHARDGNHKTGGKTKTSHLPLSKSLAAKHFTVSVSDFI